MKVLHIINGLGDGGAEGVLVRLCTYDKVNEHIVVSLLNHGKYGAELKMKGIDVHCLELGSFLKFVFGFFKLVRIIRLAKPDIVQTWLYHSDLFGGIASYFAGVRRVIWCVRNGDLISGKTKRTTILIVNTLAKISYLVPSRIVVCSLKARETHELLGYNRSIMSCIPNGYDLGRFCFDKGGRESFRSGWGVPFDAKLIGMVGRYDPVKDHENLLLAISILNRRNISFFCVLVGEDLDESNQEINRMICELEIQNRVILAGQKNDVPAVMSALDLHVLSSCTEAFPNVVAEAMACETPCIVTDVGDSGHIVGNAGWIVPPQNAQALAEGIELALASLNSANLDEIKKRARARIIANFGMDSMVSSYQAIWQEVISECAD